MVRKKYPSSHLDYYIFALAIVFVIASAAFSLVARAAGVSMWYPLILLLFPASLSLWTSRRRATMVNRVKEVSKLCLNSQGLWAPTFKFFVPEICPFLCNGTE
jgi:hypothetical protein